MKNLLLTIVFWTVPFVAFAQSGYEIEIDLKSYKEDLAYLMYYQFDKTLIKDTCNTVQNGKIVFKGKDKLNTGIYALVSKQKALLFNFFIDEEMQRLELKSDAAVVFAEDIVAVNSDRQNDFLNYIKFLGIQNDAFLKLKKNAILITKEDTLIYNKRQLEIGKRSFDYEDNFFAQSKGTYIGSVLNLKIEKILKNVPIASNNRPDSTAAFDYYRKHYWDGVDLKNDAIMKNPFFFNKLKKYFDQVVSMHPDSICVEIDSILKQTNEKGILYKSLLAYFINTYETAPVMGYDKVFVYLVDNYFKTGKAAGIYGDEGVVKRIIDRAEKWEPLLIGSTAQDLLMIKAQDFYKMKTLGFEDAKNSDELSKLYHNNITEITKMYVKLSDVKADYTILIFWDPDCSHCQFEIPILLNSYKELLKQNIDVKVYSVSMEFEGEKFIKYISDHQLHWINVYDGARINNTTQKYDINATPVIYILDKNKVIKAKRIGANQVQEIILALEVAH